MSRELGYIDSMGNDIWGYWRHRLGCDRAGWRQERARVEPAINAEEILTKLVNEKFGEILVKIEQDFGWSIVNDKITYEDATRDMKEADVKKLDGLLRQMLRILETIGIYIKHGLIDDDMVYDYLASIGPKIQERCQSFIDKERELREEPRVFEVFSETVKRWQAKDKERQ